VRRIIHPASFVFRFNGILHAILVSRGNILLQCGDLRTILVEWFVNLRNLFERDSTTIVKLILLANNLISSFNCALLQSIAFICRLNALNYTKLRG